MILTLRIAVLAWVASGLAVVACAAGKSKPAKAILPPKLLRAIDKIEAAHSAGDLEGTWRVLAPTVAGLKNDVAARFEEALAERELPGSKDILVDARLKLLTECRPGDLPSPALRERVLILQALPARVLEPLQEVADSPVMDESGAPAKNMEEFDARFKDIRRLSQELQFARLCARYAAELASKLPQTARNKMSDEERDFVSQCEGDLSAKVEKAERTVRELELETRLLRLRYGVEALAEKRLTKEKFVAATSSRRDAVALLEALKSADDAAAASAPAAGVGGTTGGAVASFTSQYTRAALSSADLVTEVERLAAEAKALAGDLADKSERFALGMEAWLRGRHGFGPDIWGLAKSQAALERSNLLRVVYMPNEQFESGDGKSDRTSTPKCPDRRHHYTWAWEDRTLVRRNGDTEYTRTWGTVPVQGDVRASLGQAGLLEENPVVKNAAVDTDVHITTVTVPPQDERLVYRIVGFVEYVEAIQLLDTFVEEATAAELEVADELIKSHDEYRIATNLSRPIEKPSALSESPLNPRDDFSRHGLEWVLALARVEVGAMLAGFTSHENPFLALAPTVYRQERVKTLPYGSAAFAEMLMDGLRTHYWSIASGDLIANYYKNGVPENHLLTYGRRAIVGRHFLKAVLAYTGAGNSGQNLPPEQKKELEKWEQTFIKLQRIMLYCLTFKVGTQKTTHYHVGMAREAHLNWIGIERDQTPDAIRRILTTADPTLIGCGCK